MGLSALTVTIAVFITQFGHRKCETIDTSSPHQFIDGIINCSSTENCTVICDEDSSCVGTTIYCPQNYSCDIHCALEYMSRILEGVCDRSTVHCPTDAPCTINCGEESCAETLFNCPTNGNCNVICEYRSCRYARINWTPDETGSISCNGWDSCDGVNFPIPSPNIDLELICSATHNCAGAIVPCPTHANCRITCSGSYCRGMDILWSPRLSINSTLICPEECPFTTKPPIYVDDDATDLYLNCETDNECYGAVIYCPKYAKCYISCTGSYSCSDQRCQTTQRNIFCQHWSAYFEDPILTC
eukprot:790022_1